MDIVKSGKFICEERKKCGLTQKELADKIGVTDKAISRWETGRGFPDVSLLKPLSDALNVSVTELIEGERIKENCLETSDKIIIEAYGLKTLLVKAVSVILIIAGIFMLLFPLYAAGFGILLNIVFPCLGILFIAAGIAVGRKKFTLRIEKLKGGYIYRPLALLGIIFAIILEALPDSFVMAFGAPPESGVEAFYTSCSYFDPLPMGYGNWFPALTAVMSCISALLLIVLIIADVCKKAGKKLVNAVFICTSTALFFSLLVNFVFVSKNTSYGFGITLLLTLALVLYSFTIRK